MLLTCYMEIGRVEHVTRTRYEETAPVESRPVFLESTQET